MGPLRLQGLSQPDSSLESLATIPALANEQCIFRGSGSSTWVLPWKKEMTAASAAAAIPVIQLLLPGFEIRLRSERFLYS